MIRALCVDDTNRPTEIPVEKWVKANELYTITSITKHVNQDGILGVKLKEISIDDLSPYNAFKASRFGISVKDIQAFIDLAKDCAELSDLNIEELINRELELYEQEVEK